MYQIRGSHFGVFIKPGPTEINRNLPVTFQLVVLEKGDENNWRPIGTEFSANKIDDLIAQLHKAKKLLDDEFEKTSNGYETRHVFF